MITVSSRANFPELQFKDHSLYLLTRFDDKYCTSLKSRSCLTISASCELSLWIHKKFDLYFNISLKSLSLRSSRLPWQKKSELITTKVLYFVCRCLWYYWNDSCHDNRFLLRQSIISLSTIFIWYTAPKGSYHVFPPLFKTSYFKWSKLLLSFLFLSQVPLCNQESIRVLFCISCRVLTYLLKKM